MADVDPDTLLEWLQMGAGEERDMQLIALEQLCMLLLMSDNVDRCFESCPPRTFLPALCRIFIDETAPDNVLEVGSSCPYSISHPVIPGVIVKLIVNCPAIGYSPCYHILSGCVC